MCNVLHCWIHRTRKGVGRDLRPIASGRHMRWYKRAMLQLRDLEVWREGVTLTVHLVLAGKAFAGAIKCTPQMEPVGTQMETASALANKGHVVASTVAVGDTMISAVQESASQGIAKASNHILMYSSRAARFVSRERHLR
ncbi:hypothetical protein CGCSCA4_v013600 [Colletotrichum siamense]|uniref:Uncharacterized protein n=1 Tax=Colletotrichum siamense TaxID=690259 RepID=A0A9P5EQU4_COLSI|nr:hypothetical protein CGCSCA4_v013600 [Colletotrichum siamense]KAF4857756.1 hypothetical protein CGCSCA2_v007846 [Colletotrichum siamense]